MTYKTLLVEKIIQCPMCSEILNVGDVMYEDDYRGEVLCAYCKEDYEESVYSAEGENGEFIR